MALCSHYIKHQKRKWRSLQAIAVKCYIHHPPYQVHLASTTVKSFSSRTALLSAAWLLMQCEIEWIFAFMFTPSSYPAISLSLQESRLRPGNIFPNFCCPVLLGPRELYLSILQESRTESSAAAAVAHQYGTLGIMSGCLSYCLVFSPFSVNPTDSHVGKSQQMSSFKYSDQHVGPNHVWTTT